MDEMCFPSFEDTKARIPDEINHRTGVERQVQQLVNAIPVDILHIDEAVERVQWMLMTVFKYIRNMLCDQMELFADSFFQLPLSRQLESEMVKIQLDESTVTKFAVDRKNKQHELDRANDMLTSVAWCINAISTFQRGYLLVGTGQGAASGSGYTGRDSGLVPTTSKSFTAHSRQSSQFQ